MSFKQWNETKAYVKEWIEYYHTIVVSLLPQNSHLNDHYLTALFSYHQGKLRSPTCLIKKEVVQVVLINKVQFLIHKIL